MMLIASIPINMVIKFIMKLFVSIQVTKRVAAETHTTNVEIENPETSPEEHSMFAKLINWCHQFITFAYVIDDGVRESRMNCIQSNRVSLQSSKMVRPTPSKDLPVYYLLHTTEHEYGVCLLHHWYGSMLAKSYPRSVMKLYLTYVHREFIHVRHVSKYLQWFGMMLIVAMNVGAMYYVALKGISKGPEWQKSYLKLYAFSFISDVLFVQTFEVLWIDFWLPSMIYDEVLQVHQRVLQFCMFDVSIGDMFNDTLDSHKADETSDISFQLARLSPTLLESRLLLSYLQTQHVQVRDSPLWIANQRNYWIVQLMSVIPLELHSILAALAASLLQTLVIFLWYFNVIIVVVFVVFGVIVLMVWLRYHQHHENVTKPEIIANQVAVKELKSEWFEVSSASSLSSPSLELNSEDVNSEIQHSISETSQMIEPCQNDDISDDSLHLMQGNDDDNDDEWCGDSLSISISIELSED